MNDSGAYRDILNVSIPIVPEQTKGRALTTINKKAVEVQFAVPFNTNDEALRTSKIHEIYSMMREVSGKVEYHCDMSALDNATDQLELSYIPASETKMEVLASIEDDGNSLIIGADVSTKELKGFELTNETRIFVGVKDNSSVIPSIVNRYASNSEKRICLITSKDTNEFDYSVEIIDDVDEFISEYVEMETQERQNILLVIDGFCDFYDRISDEALFVLERALKANAEMNIVTFDSMQRLKDYRDTGLYVYLIRSYCGVILGGCIDDTIAAAITASVVVVVGSVSYIGLIIPNLVTMFKGDKIRGTLVDTALAGALYVLLCDVIARIVIVPYELPIALISGIVGSVIFIVNLFYRLKHGRKAIRLGAATDAPCATAGVATGGGAKR